MSAVTSIIRQHVYAIFGMRRTIGNHSYFRDAFIVLFVLFFELGLLALFGEGLLFLGRIGGVGLMLIYRLFSLSFLGLGIMLIISSIVTSYASIYRSRELPFLMAAPYSTSNIVIYKFLESTFFSSWAFFFIIVPFVAAYAWHESLTPFFVIWTIFFSIPFVIVACAIGSLITIIIVRWIPRGRTLKALGILFLAAAIAVIWYAARTTHQADDPGSLVMNRLIPGLQLASYPLLPSWWVSEGIISMSRGQWLRGLMMWILLTANALMACLVVEAAGRAFFYEGLQKVMGGSSRGRRSKPLLSWLSRLLTPVAHDIRAIIMKDLRTLLRDPLQWSQFLIFFGLLGIYFSSLRAFQYDEQTAIWRIFIAFLNIFSMSTVLCSLASRFIYPQLSLEGQGFWILGLAPTTMGRVLMTKFLSALVGMSLVCTTLMYLSTRMLRVNPEIQTVALFLSICISLSVTGLSTGLGAIFLDLRQRNPAAIVSGFGGTLNLVLSLAFMLASVIPFAAVFHLDLLQKIPHATAVSWLRLSYVWVFVLTLACVALPLAIGRRSLMRREY